MGPFELVPCQQVKKMHKRKTIKLEAELKHNLEKYHHIKDLVKMDLVKLIFCTKQENVANMMIKSLGPSKIKKLRRQAGLMNGITRVEEECCMYATHAIKITTRRHRTSVTSPNK